MTVTLSDGLSVPIVKPTLGAYNGKLVPSTVTEPATKLKTGNANNAQISGIANISFFIITFTTILNHLLFWFNLF